MKLKHIKMLPSGRVCVTLAPKETIDENLFAILKDGEYDAAGIYYKAGAYSHSPTDSITIYLDPPNRCTCNHSTFAGVHDEGCPQSDKP